MASVISPTPGDVHVNRPLTNISLAFLQDQSAFVADRIFPNIPVSNQTDVYFRYDRGEFNRDDMELKGLTSESAGNAYTVDSQGTYHCPIAALHRDIPDPLRANQDAPLNLDREATLYVTHKGLIYRERKWTQTFFATGAWTFEIDGNATATAKASLDPTDGSNNKAIFWDDPSSTPIEDMRFGMTRMQEETGFRPNKLTLGRPVYDILVDHPDIVGRLDRGQTSGPATANRESIAGLLELDEVMVADAIYNTGRKGDTASHSFIAGKHALLSYAPASPGIMTPSAGYTFSWTGYLGATDQGMRIRRKRNDMADFDRVEIDQAFDQHKVSADLGYFFKDMVR